MITKLPAPIMTAEEIEQAEEESLEAMRDWLDSQQQKPKSEQRSKIDSRMLRTPEAAKYLGISEWKLRQMVHDGELDYVSGKYWKFDVQSLNRWIEANREKRL